MTTRTTGWGYTVMSTSTDRFVRAAVVAGLLTAPLAGRADTVASLLGDFTINQYCGLKLADDALDVHLAVVFGQLPALRELHQADANGDGVTTQEERDAYVSRLAPGLADKLQATLDGARLPLRVMHWTSSLPKEQNGFSMRIDIDFAAPLASRSGAAVRSLQFENRNFAGRIGWHEIAVQAAPDLTVFDTDAAGSSLTGGLAEALQALPANGPLDERAAHMSFTSGPVPAGARMLAARDGASVPRDVVAAAPVSAERGWLPTQTARLVGLISTPDVPWHIALLALAAAMLLGALHALSPGHGKAIVGAYLIGSRGTPRHAAFLGVTVTITHTLVVFGLGLATLAASQFIVAERLLPALSLVSGLLVLGMGVVLMAQRWPTARGAWRSMLRTAGARAGASAGRRGLMLLPAHAGRHAHAAVHAHGGHSHGHDHDHRTTTDMPMPMCTRTMPRTRPAMRTRTAAARIRICRPAPPARAVTWRGLLALGVSGGLLPCPSAMVLLLAAVALHKTLFGLVLVLAFSVGLAITLTAVGLAFLYARNRFERRLGPAALDAVASGAECRGDRAARARALLRHAGRRADLWLDSTDPGQVCPAPGTSTGSVRTVCVASRSLPFFLCSSGACRSPLAHCERCA